MIGRPRSGPPELTPRELEVVYGAMRGEITSETAARLFLSPHTIKFHRQHAMLKLGAAKTMTEAVVHGLATGVLTFPDYEGPGLSPEAVLGALSVVQGCLRDALGAVEAVTA